jgi:uncharacterized protein YjiS (DUF1127 family)
MQGEGLVQGRKRPTNRGQTRRKIMLNIAHPSVRAWLSPGRIGGQVRSLFANLELALRIRSERQTLAELDERTLKDIGFNRSDAYAESGRSFWDLPVDRLRA